MKQEIYQNTNATIIFTKAGSKPHQYWHYVAVGKKTGRVSSGDKSLDAKIGLIRTYEYNKMTLHSSDEVKTK